MLTVESDFVRFCTSLSTNWIDASIQTVSEAAVSFLLSKYLNGSRFTYLPNLYASTPSTSMLSNITCAVALASFACERSHAQLLTLSRKKYDRSLLQLTSALAYPQVSTSDETLATTLLLTQYEHFSNDTGRDINQAYSKHVLGILEITKLRGTSNFSSPIWCALFKQAMDNVTLYSIQNSKPLPTDFVQLEREFLAATLSNPTWFIHVPSIKFFPVRTAFCAYRIQYLRYRDKDPWGLIYSALAIDGACIEFYDQMTPHWDYRVVSKNGISTGGDYEDAVVHGESFHIYESHRAAQLWNTVRMMRLTLHSNILDLVRQILSTGVSAEQAERLQSISSISEMITNKQISEICASVPQFLTTKYRQQGTGVAAGYILVWPLFVAAQYGPELCRDFAANRLKSIGTELKIQSATMAAKKLEKNDSYDWVHVTYCF